MDEDNATLPAKEGDDFGSSPLVVVIPIGAKVVLGSQTWVFCERWPRTYAPRDGYELLFRNADAPGVARWMHPDEIQVLYSLGAVILPEGS